MMEIICECICGMMEIICECVCGMMEIMYGGDNPYGVDNYITIGIAKFISRFSVRNFKLVKGSAPPVWTTWNPLSTNMILEILDGLRQWLLESAF